MFKYCLWYLLKNDHPINRLIQHNALRFGTTVFPAHVTIEHSIQTKEEAETKMNRYKEAVMPSFGFSGAPFASTTSIRNFYNSEEAIFHAIEQPLWINGTPIEGVHISLAYKVGGKPFSPVDVGCSISHFTYRINNDEIKPVVFSCHSENPEQWKLICS